MTTQPAPPQKAVELGHLLKWDPPAAPTAAKRWTCTGCGDAALDYLGNVYGSATERTCEQATADWAALGYGKNR